MFFASYIRRQHVKFMVRLIVLFDFRCSFSLLRVLVCFQESSIALAFKSSGAIKVISGATILTMRVSDNITAVIFIYCSGSELSVRVQLNK